MFPQSAFSSFFSCDNEGDVLPLTIVHLPQPNLCFAPNRSCGSFKSKSKGFGPSWTTLYAQCTHLQLSVLYCTTYERLSELECSRQEAWHTLCLEQLGCCTASVHLHIVSCLYSPGELPEPGWPKKRFQIEHDTVISLRLVVHALCFDQLYGWVYTSTVFYSCASVHVYPGLA